VTINEAIDSCFKNLIGQTGLQFDQQSVLYGQLPGDMGMIIEALSKHYGDKCDMNSVQATVVEYIKHKVQMLKQQAQGGMFGNFNNQSSNAGNFDFGGAFSSKPNVQSFFGGGGSQINTNSFFGGGQSQNFPPSSHLNPQTPTQTTTPEVKEEIVDQIWTISDKVEKIVDTIALDISTRRCVNNGKDVRLIDINFALVPNVMGAVSMCDKHIDKTKPFICQISAWQPISIDIEPSIIYNLTKLYRENEMYDSDITTSKNPVNTQTAKALIKIVTSYIDTIQSKYANRLEKFFMDRIRPLVQIHLINPNELDTELLPTELSDLLEFYSGPVYDELSQFEYFEGLRDIIVCKVLRDFLSNGNICSWENPMDRLPIIQANSNLLFNELPISYVSLMRASDKDLEVYQELIAKCEDGSILDKQPLTVVKIPFFTMYTNIIPPDMQYRFGTRQRFTPYNFTTPNNVLEDLIISQNKIQEHTTMIIRPDKWTTYSCAYGSIIDGTMRIAPMEN